MSSLWNWKGKNMKIRKEKKVMAIEIKQQSGIKQIQILSTIRLPSVVAVSTAGNQTEWKITDI